MTTKRRRFSAYVLSLLLIMMLLAGAFAVTYGAASRHLEDTTRAVDEAAFREAVTAVETRIALADLVLTSVLRSRSMRDFATQNYESGAARRIETAQMQRSFRTYFTALPGLVALAVVSESGETIATDLGVFTRDDFWDPTGLDLAETAPVQGTFVPARSVTMGDFEGAWSGEVVAIARGYPVGAAPNLTLGGGLLYLDARELRGIFQDLEERTGVSVRVEVDPEPSRATNTDDPFWSAEPIVGARSGWTYRARVSDHPGTRVLAFRRLFAYVALALMALAAVVVTWLDRAARKPFETVITHIADRVYRVRRATEAAGPELSLTDVENEVRSIVDKAQHLQSQVELSLPALRWQLLVERLLSPYGPAPSDLADATGLRLAGPVFTVVLIVPGRTTPSDLPGTADAVSEQLVARALESWGSIETVRLMDSTIAGVISSEQAAEPNEIGSALGTVMTFDPNAVAAIGRSCDGADAVHRSYLSARETLEYQIVSPGKRVYVFGSLPETQTEALPGAIESVLRDVPPILHRESEARLEGWLDDYFDVAMTHAASPAILKHAVARLVLTMREEARRVNAGSAYPADDLVHEIWATTSLERMREIAERAASLAQSTVHEHKASNPRDYRLGTDLAAFVDHNFHRTDLSLSMVAESFRVSPSHASRVFRSTVGQTFQSYVTHQRVKLAEDLLATTAQPVTRIAAEVGYGEVHSLIRSFKKATGVTPAEFRRRAARRDLATPATSS